MVFITGDTHREFRRFTTKRFPVQKGMTKDDIVIIAGDAGIILDKEKSTPYEKHQIIKWLNAKPFTTVFVDGNHENFDRLFSDFPLVDFYGGKAYKISHSIFWLKRGELFEFGGEVFWAFGGAQTHDTEHFLVKDGPGPGGINHYKNVVNVLKRNNEFYRTIGEDWWPQEMPTKEEMEHGLKRLEAVNWKVDYVITHCAPTSLFKPLNAVGMEPNELTDFFDEVSNKLEFKKWFFGHHHKDMELGRFRAIYHDIIKIL